MHLTLNKNLLYCNWLWLLIDFLIQSAISLSSLLEAIIRPCFHPIVFCTFVCLVIVLLIVLLFHLFGGHLSFHTPWKWNHIKFNYFQVNHSLSFSHWKHNIKCFLPLKMWIVISKSNKTHVTLAEPDYNCKLNPRVPLDIFIWNHDTFVKNSKLRMILQNIWKGVVGSYLLPLQVWIG